MMLTLQLLLTTFLGISDSGLRRAEAKAVGLFHRGSFSCNGGL